MSASHVHTVAEVGDPRLGSRSRGSAAKERQLGTDAVIYSVFPGCALPKKGSCSACSWREEEELGPVALLSTLAGLGVGMYLARGRAPIGIRASGC